MPWEAACALGEGELLGGVEAELCWGCSRHSGRCRRGRRVCRSRATLRAELGGAERADVAAGTGADDDEIVRK